MKLLFVISSLNLLGGTERVATMLANALSKKYEVSILSRKPKEDTSNAFKLNDTVNDIKFAGSNASFIKQCKTYVAQNNPDIVIVHTMSKLTPVLLLSGIKANKIWSLEHISFSFHSAVFRYLRHRLYNKLDKVITLTSDDAQNYNFLTDRVSTIVNINPLEIKSPSYVSDSKIIISIGRLTYQKGYDLLLEAWSLIEKGYPDWSLHIYGEGEDRENLEQKIRDYNLNNIALKGITNDVESVYDNAAFYVMSSRFEGFGMVLIEAQSRGLPIVSFDCPSGPAEIIEDGVNGYLVKNADIEILADRISYLIDNDQSRQELSKNALISARRFEPEVIIKQWVDLIDRECEYSGKY